MSGAALRCTAIVPTLDRPAELEACLRSLAAARPPFEAILVADQGDGSLETAVGALGARFLHLEQRGLSRARNAALTLAATPWLYFPDDDCTVAPDILGCVADALVCSPFAGFVAAHVRTPTGGPAMAGMDGRARALTTAADALATVMSPGLFVAARVFERCGSFDERFGIAAEWPSGEESDLLFRALAAGETGLYVPEAVVNHTDPFTSLDPAARRRRARLYGRGWGALFAKHANGPGGATYAALQRRYEARALAGMVLAAFLLRPNRARWHWQSWRGRREGWRGWRAAAGRGR